MPLQNINYSGRVLCAPIPRAQPTQQPPFSAARTARAAPTQTKQDGQPNYAPAQIHGQPRKSVLRLSGYSHLIGRRFRLRVRLVYGSLGRMALRCHVSFAFEQLALPQHQSALSVCCCRFAPEQSGFVCDQEPLCLRLRLCIGRSRPLLCRCTQRDLARALLASHMLQPRSATDRMQPAAQPAPPLVSRAQQPLLLWPLLPTA